jgi:hypothetical protein
MATHINFAVAVFNIIAIWIAMGYYPQKTIEIFEEFYWEAETFEIQI